MATTTTSYGLKVDFSRCAWELRDCMHDKGLQTIHFTNLMGTGGLCGPGTYIWGRFQEAKALGRKLVSFMGDLLDSAEDDVLCMGNWPLMGGDAYVLFAYEDALEPSHELLTFLGRVLATMVEEAAGDLTLEGLAQSSGVSPVLRQLASHYGGDWGRLARALSAEGEVGVEATSGGSVEGHVLRMAPGQDDAGEAIPVPAPQPLPKEVPAWMGKARPVDVADAVIPGYPPHAIANKASAAVQRQIADMMSQVRIEAWPRLCAQLRELTGHEGPDEDAWLAIVAQQVAESRIVRPTGQLPGYVKLPLLRDKGGRPIFAILAPSSVPSDVRLTLESFMDHDGASASVSIGVPPRPDRTFHVLDYLRYLQFYAERRAKSLAREDFAGLGALVGSGMPVPADLLDGLVRYAQTWDEMSRVLGTLGEHAENLTQIGTLTEDWFARFSQSADYREVLREVVDACSERFKRVVPWGHPVITADLERLDSSDELGEKDLRSLADIYVALVDEMARDEPYAARGSRLKMVEGHLLSLDAVFDQLQEAFRADPIDLSRLRRVASAPVAPEEHDDASFQDVPSWVDGTTITDESIESASGAQGDLGGATGGGFFSPAYAPGEDELLSEALPSFGDDASEELPDAPGQADLLFGAEAELDGAGAPDNATQESMRQEAAWEPAGDGLRERFPAEWRKGFETGIACNVAQLFELGHHEVWPAVESPTGTSVFARAALLGHRGVDDLVSCVEAALRDGVRPGLAYRIALPARDALPADSADPRSQRLWAMVALADRMGVAAGNVSVDQLVEDCEYLAMGEGTLSLGPALSCLLAEAYLTAVTRHVSGQMLEVFSAFLGRLDEHDLHRLGKLPARLNDLLACLRESYSYAPAIDYSDAILPSLGAACACSQFEVLARSAGEIRASKPGSGHQISQLLWTQTLLKDDEESHIRVGCLLADIESLGERARTDRHALSRLRRDIEDSLDNDHRHLFWEKSPRGAWEKIVGRAREDLRELIRRTYDLYERYLDLREQEQSVSAQGPMSEEATCLGAAHDEVASALRGLRNEQRAGWERVVERALELQASYPGGAPEPLDDLSADLSVESLPPDLRGEEGLALVELLLHDPGLRTEGRLLVLGSGQLAERVGSCLVCVERSFTYNAVDERLYDLIVRTLARTLGAAEAAGGSPQGAAATRALLAQWTVELIDARVVGLASDLVARTAARLRESGSLDERSRAVLEDAIAQGDIARVFAYADYEVDNAVISPGAAPHSYEDEFFGAAGGSVGLIDPICRAIMSGGRQMGYRKMEFDSELVDPFVDRAEKAREAYERIRRSIGGIKSLIREHRLPINGASVPSADPGMRKPLEDVARYLTGLFSELGFTDASVTESVSHADTSGMVSSWRLRFFASPSQTDSRGELVCPLREFVTLVEPLDGRGPARVEYEVELYTSYQALASAIGRELPDASFKRVALYLDPEPNGSEVLTPQRRRTLMPARTAPWSLDAPGALLLDEALAAYLASVPCSDQGSDKWDRLSAFFRCALPFTAPQPYGDDTLKSAASSVPGGTAAGQPPLFYGRSMIIQQLRSRSGRTFIYGARRMGKTSILREFAAEERASMFDPVRASKESVCVHYRDMQHLAGLGLDNFWLEVVGKGFARDVPKLGEARSAEEVREILSEASAGRCFYLLIDEADNLLRFDSFVRADHPRNAIMNSLVAYMAQNDRFRVVLGGLHATMRYAEERANENHTRGQLSHAEPVGPLWEGGAYEDAVRLVREPLKMMGYVIDDDDVLKILNKACYFPNLISIICEQLLLDLRQHRQPGLGTGSFVRIPGVTVERILNESTGALAEKFQLTIELDRGYSVATSALNSLEEDCAERGEKRRAFTVEELVDQVRSVCSDEELGSPIDARRLEESDLFKNLGDDIRELIRFGILKQVDERVMLRDGSMRALVGRRQGRHNARMALLGACRGYLERDVLDGRLDGGEARNVVASEGGAIFSPLNARNLAAVERRLSGHGHCVLVMGDLAGAGMLLEHLAELAPELCRGTRPAVVDGGGLAEALGHGSDDGLLVVSGGWGAQDLRALRERGASAGRVLLVASPCVAWELRSELSGASDVVTPSPWGTWTCALWAEDHARDLEVAGSKEVRERARRSVVRALGDRCGGQTGAIAEVMRAVSGSASSRALVDEMRSFSARALEGRDFAWVLDGSCPDAAVIRCVWEGLLGLADADPAAEHPLADCCSVADWLSLLEDGSAPDEAGLAEVLEWMVAVGLARCAPMEGTDAEGIEMCDWFMHALVGRAAEEEGDAR